MRNRVFNSKQAFLFSKTKKPKFSELPARKNVELITQHYFVFFDKGFDTAI